MKVYIFTLIENLQACNDIAIHLRAIGYECTVFESIEKFMIQVDEHEDLPDLYVLDFFIYNHYVFNAYNYLKQNKCYVPLIFFNDPQRKSGSINYFWKNMLDLIYTPARFEWNRYQALIGHVTNFAADALNEKSVSNSPKKTEHTHSEATPKNLSSSEIVIYKTLLSKINESISISELQASIKKTSKTCRESTIACIISSLRKKLKASNIENKQIIKNGSGYKMISL